MALPISLSGIERGEASKSEADFDGTVPAISSSGGDVS
jgi:hypothetical protein